MSKSIIYTIGHSTRPIEEFLHMLKAFAVRQLIDVRTVPKSRFNPRFAQERLAPALKVEDIEYQHMPGLGGMRKPNTNSINTGWRNSSFRGYADYMQTAQFAQNLTQLMIASRKATIVIMCAEAVPWRCHRSLIADALLMNGIEVKHIMSATKADSAKMNPMAEVKDQKITYVVKDERDQGSLFSL